MKNSARRALLVAMLATVAITASACGPETAQAMGEFAFGIYGAALGIGLLVAIIAASLPRS